MQINNHPLRLLIKTKQNKQKEKKQKQNKSKTNDQKTLKIKSKNN